MKDYKFLCEKYGAFLSEDEEYYFSFREAICEHLYYTERDNLIKQLKRKNSWLLNYIMPFKGNKFFLNGMFSIALNIGFYTSDSCTGILGILNICWSFILAIVVFSFIATITDESKLINMSCRYGGHVKYNDISIEDRKTLALNAFYMIFSWTFSGAIFVYIPFIILKVIGKLLVVVIPSLIIDRCIGDIKPKKTKSTLQEEFNDLIKEN